VSARAIDTAHRGKAFETSGIAAPLPRAAAAKRQATCLETWPQKVPCRECFKGKGNGLSKKQSLLENRRH
jgi:hypothetical protein